MTLLQALGLGVIVAPQLQDYSPPRHPNIEIKDLCECGCHSGEGTAEEGRRKAVRSENSAYSWSWGDTGPFPWKKHH